MRDGAGDTCHPRERSPGRRLLRLLVREQLRGKQIIAAEFPRLCKGWWGEPGCMIARRV